ncbi:transposase [Verrucomicrobiaceae bacterium R5-34]|uniref:Transposase n=1 Tax=Oceaniferula flava TaxID=2800421 RepID=A0AAE2SFU9_9BACT|nr:transposase [Oceaniferula flavus]MBK1831779.1 transposase [Verrucomicrobiaceae bacterium R5-34]MBK1856104.1 transposase [Oceaniferula flavus]MBM1137411.1 transposase [Oceaniferula flavus]
MKDYDPGEETETSRRKLPHWQQPGCSYFITFRLHDSIPKGKFDEWNEERLRWLRSRKLDSNLPLDQILEQLTPEQKKTYYATFWKGYHSMLDACYGSCPLRDPVNAQIVADALVFFHEERYQLGDFIIMPNHVHVLVTPFQNWPIKDLLHSWKRHTAREINQRMGLFGQLWQHESYDHIVRNEAQLKRIEAYIRNNPKNLRQGEYLYQSRTTL